MKHKKYQKEHRRIATLEMRWAADAHRDEKYNLGRAMQERRAGNIVLSRGYAHEAAWDNFWWQRRVRLARHERYLAGY